MIELSQYLIELLTICFSISIVIVISCIIITKLFKNYINITVITWIAFSVIVTMLVTGLIHAQTNGLL